MRLPLLGFLIVSYLLLSANACQRDGCDEPAPQVATNSWAGQYVGVFRHYWAGDTTEFAPITLVLNADSTYAITQMGQHLTRVRHHEHTGKFSVQPGANCALLFTFRRADVIDLEDLHDHPLMGMNCGEQDGDTLRLHTEFMNYMGSNPTFEFKFYNPQSY